MIKIKINMVQNRIATGRDQSALTIFKIVKGYHGTEDVDLVLVKDARYFDIIGEINIRHPKIMWGNWEEILQDFWGIAKKEMMKTGLFKENSYGVMFLE
jgi:hypothetical protein